MIVLALMNVYIQVVNVGVVLCIVSTQNVVNCHLTLFLPVGRNMTGLKVSLFTFT